ncbi:unnamed protein product [Zymoseptoria tritici ST99CH_3D7]|uniref:Uncharacterized protein n=1 Tax=Zymoseptoria tritici (strain ST99CH_3D7) TaxID=1276538 RepID=A0A1X7RW92_ZYMT9|nr:unnamed protein product [Zymoseptoria tritici ST99CH_3D7]
MFMSSESGKQGGDLKRRLKVGTGGLRVYLKAVQCFPVDVRQMASMLDSYGFLLLSGLDRKWRAGRVGIEWHHVL